MASEREPTDFPAESPPKIAHGKRPSAEGRTRTGKGPQFLRFVVPIIEILPVARRVWHPARGDERSDRGTAYSRAGATQNASKRCLANFKSDSLGEVLSGERRLPAILRAGGWTLTEKGLAAKLRERDLYELFKRVRDRLPKIDEQSF